MNGRDKKFTEIFILKIKPKNSHRVPKGVNGRIKCVVKSEIWGCRMDSAGKGYKPVLELVEGGGSL